LIKEVIRQESGTHFQILILLISIVDISLVIYTIVYNKGLSSMSENSMAGSSSLTLLRNGAKFVPCMKSTEETYLNKTITCIFTDQTTTYEECIRYLCNTEISKVFHIKFIVSLFQCFYIVK